MGLKYHKICVYYDGACQSCIKDRDNYLWLAGSKAKDVHWVDITHKEQELMSMGIDPKKALKELHIRLESSQGKSQILSELDAYIVLMNKTRLLKPIGWVIALPVIRPMLSKLYHFLVNRRLKSAGRL